ncbi:MAG: cytochrome c family protein [Deltaproteobacteria bacterium]|nr:cytochrome c family protein [Deltaproteobacteria bacterium]MBW2019181.1 cytochrome c family protein [Deltaproteobacteria bacterium]MBW2073984.1 cytochrome c family protein [Deltaproteobacteria bacterium]
MKVKKRLNQFKGLVYPMFFIFLCAPVWAQDSKPNTYVGSDTCLLCHEAEYDNFSKYARKSKSFQSVLKMRKGLTADEVKGCYACHTTGYGKPGGFVSIEQTPELKDAGCEVCHGPGGRHSETQDPDHIIGKVTIDVCQKCHTQERVSAFRYRPMLYGGAH